MFMTLVMTAGCTQDLGDAGRRPLQQSPSVNQLPAESGVQLLASNVQGVLPGTRLLPASPGTEACPQGIVAVVRMVLPERVLFETASDQPARAADAMLDFVAQRIEHDVPAAEVTVLGHTDAVGADAYNVDLSRRRAETVLRALAARRLPPSQLSAVAVGKRQPIAENDTPEGRAQNRRVEFLVSPCLAANLEVFRRAPTDAADNAASAGPLDVVRLEPTPAGSYELGRVAVVALNGAADGRSGEAGPVPMASQPRRAQDPTRTPRLLPRPAYTRPSPSAAYQPKALAPDAEPKSLGPAVSY